ncbi:DMT family transporter [Sulfobacillus thermosulfidooxidans]|uniref:DMT family transporter n=1 Tax=Sulfobacillus thermosulfidooxidans TaxID=28034 RepID=UPI0006B66610|nr:DMT family transporter [Sulfobacillus thermosulfidooxidans]
MNQMVYNPDREWLRQWQWTPPSHKYSEDEIRAIMATCQSYDDLATRYTEEELHDADRSVIELCDKNPQFRRDYDRWSYIVENGYNAYVWKRIQRKGRIPWTPISPWVQAALRRDRVVTTPDGQRVVQKTETERSAESWAAYHRMMDWVWAFIAMALVDIVFAWGIFVFNHSFAPFQHLWLWPSAISFGLVFLLRRTHKTHALLYNVGVLAFIIPLAFLIAFLLM